MVFQGYALYPHLTARDNIAFPLKMRDIPAAERTRRVDEAAALLGLGRLLDRRPGELSGGERQRVAMGRAIVRRPKVFLFDEPSPTWTRRCAPSSAWRSPRSCGGSG